jgi:hypothetical protein
VGISGRADGRGRLQAAGRGGQEFNHRIRKVQCIKFESIKEVSP